MRLVLKVVMVIAVVFGGVNYVAYLQTGRLPLSLWAEKTMVAFRSFKKDASRALGSVTDAATGEGESQVIYKWTDAQGVLQYTNVAPPANVAVEVVEVDPNANLVPAAPVQQSEPVPVPAAAAGEVKEKTPAGYEMSFPYSPEEVKKNFDDARKGQQMMQERMQKQQEILDNL